MNEDQFNFVCKKLGFDGVRKESCKAVIVEGLSSYKAEAKYERAKGTMSRDVLRCRRKWQELLSDAKIMKKWV